jgi:protein-tyrosine phosphatase
VELPDFGIMPNFGGTLYDFNVRDIVPILTHPERNSTLAHNPSLMAGWLRQGLLTQVTAGSLLGLMGKTAERAAHKLLENRWVHFIATDAHNARSRAPRMSAVCDLIAKRYDSEYARRLCVDNPMAVFKGHILPAQEEPLHLDNEAVNTNSFRSRLQRLFRMS